MNDLPADLVVIENRIDAIDRAEAALRNEVSRLHSHVTRDTANSLEFLHHQIYELKHALFFPEMRFDKNAFNGQFSKHLVWNELRPRLVGTLAVETGTYQGGTTAFLARSFERVVTIEVDPGFWEEAKRNAGESANIEFVLADSATYLSDHVESWAAAGKIPEFFYLDAHWGTVCPLLSEVEVISRMFPDAILMIDDMEVPDDNGYAFDHYETAILDRAYLAPAVEKFELACFVPRLASAKDCMSKFMVDPRGTWFVAQTPESIAKLAACDSLHRL